MHIDVARWGSLAYNRARGGSAATPFHHVRRKLNMIMDKKTLIFPVLLIAVGVGWLLTELDLMPGIDWVWILGLAGCGMLAFLVCGFNKVTVVVGTFFLVTSCLALLRQVGWLELNIEMPLLVLIAGVLLLVARHPSIPAPQWMLEASRAT